MDYPREFSAQALARVEAERLQAGKQLERWMKRAAGSPSLSLSARTTILRRYILRVFLVFAQEAFALCSAGFWTVPRVRLETDEFLRKFTIDSYYGRGRNMGLLEMTSHINGSILPEVRRAFEELPEWRKFERGLLAVAKAAAAEQKPLTAEKADGRRAMIGAFIQKVRDETGRKIGRKDIATVAGYNNMTDFYQFQRDDPRTTDSAMSSFERVLATTPADFLRLLDRKKAAK